jgi:shikimate dehydrogenase
MQHGRPPISTATRLYGMFLHAPEQRALVVPGLFNAMLDRHGVDAIFIPLQVTPERLEPAIAGMRHLRDFSGFCVTMPHKAAVAKLCDVLMPNAQACGVVNAVRIDAGGRMIGETFDGVGMVKAIAAQRDLGGRTRVLLVGAGGVAKAIAVALALEGVGQLAIMNRTHATAGALAETVRRAAPACKVEAGGLRDPADFDIVINATSLGVNADDPMPVDISRISPAALVVEVVAAPPRTRLLDAATARGLAVVPGMAMMTPQLELMADFLGITALS